MISKQELDKLVFKYETPDFIKDDPIQFPHRFKNKCDAEISALIASCLAYGKREKIIAAVDTIHNLIGNKPYEFCMNYKLDNGLNLFKDFAYRYTSGVDIALLCHVIHCSLKNYGSLEAHFVACYKKADWDLKQALAYFVDELVAYIPEDISPKGLKYLLPNSSAGSACKRLNLFLKWMVRKPPVDLGLWNNIPTNILMIPLDVHVANISRKLSFTVRKSNDWKTAQEITDRLKSYDPKDPAKYDFALFGLGINKEL